MMAGFSLGHHYVYEVVSAVIICCIVEDYDIGLNYKDLLLKKKKGALADAFLLQF